MADLCSSSALPLLFPFHGALHMPGVCLLRCALSPALRLSTTDAFSHPSLLVRGRQAALLVELLPCLEGLTPVRGGGNLPSPSEDEACC